MVVISRDFENPKKVVADVTVASAVQTPWPDNDQVVDTRKFNSFAPDQVGELDQFVRKYSTFISGCVGAPT